MAIAAEHTKTLQVWSGRIGHGFLVLASIITFYAGWIWGDGNIVKSLVFGAFMGLCPWAVAYMLPFISIARQSGRSGTAAVMFFVVAIAGAMEWRAEMMVFAGQRQTSSVTATLQNTRFEDARKTVSTLEGQLKTAQVKLDEQTPYGPSASYQARIEAAEGLAARESSKDRKGCQKRCDEAKAIAADLRAKQAIALDRETNTKPEVDRLTKELADAKALAGSTKAGDSMSVAEAEVLAAFWTGNLKPGNDAMKWTDMLMGAFMAVFLLIVPTQLIYNSKIDWDAPKTRRKSRMFANLMAWLRGDKIEPETVASNSANDPLHVTNNAGHTVNVTVQKQDDIWQAIHSALGGQKRIAG